MESEQQNVVTPKTDKRTYMREYKRKQYQENKAEMQQTNKVYYYKYKFKSSSEEMHKFKDCLPSVLKIRKELDELVKNRPELINEILEPYLQKNDIII